MMLTQQQFKNRYKLGNLRLCFIGMSNIGKSYCGQLLRDNHGFKLYEVDNFIQAALDIVDMEEASTWMGYPYEKRHKKNEKEYLKIEQAKTRGVHIPATDNLVLDTTGSAIYLDETTHAWLKDEFLIVNFDVSQSMIQDMMGEFFRSPKTVVWNGSFSQKKDELGIDALRRCYPALLEDRIERYRNLADINIPGEFSRQKGLEAERLLEVLKLSLPKE